jgi:hypothetical protein
MLCSFIQQAEARGSVPVISSKCVLLDPLQMVDSTLLPHPYFSSPQKPGLQLLHVMLELALGCRIHNQISLSLL